MRAAGMVALLVLASCSKSKAGDLRSSAFPSAKERVGYLCEYMACPAKPLDVAFHIVVHDSSGLLPGPGDAELNAVVKVKPDDVPHWSRGCDSMRFHPRPPWADALFTELKIEPKTAPDIWGCPNSQRRVIHAKEGIIVLWQKSQ